jgi:hypothetical protein
VETGTGEMRFLKRESLSSAVERIWKRAEMMNDHRSRGLAGIN